MPRLRRLLPLLMPVVTAAALAAHALQQERPNQRRDGGAIETDESVAVSARRKVRTKSEYPTLPAAQRIALEKRELSAPVLVPLRDGRALLACLAWEIGGGDRLLAAEVDASHAQPFVEVVRQPTQIVQPCGVVDARGAPHLFWTEIREIRDARQVGAGKAGKDGQEGSDGKETRSHAAPRLFTAWRDEAGKWSEPHELTLASDCGGLALHPSAARAQDGSLWLAFQGYGAAQDGKGRGSYDVFLAPLVKDAELGAAIRVGDTRFSEVDPVLVAPEDGALTVVFSQFRGRDYEVVARSFDPLAKKLGEVVDVSGDPLADDLHPAAAAAKGGGVWIAWDTFRDARRGSSFPIHNDPAGDPEGGVRLALLRGSEVRLPIAKDGALDAPDTLFCWSGGAPVVALDACGRPVLACRFLDQPLQSQRGRPYEYPLLIARYDADHFVAQTMILESGGKLESAAIARGEGGLLVVGQRDLCEEHQFRGYFDPFDDATESALLERGIDLCGTIGPSTLTLAFVPDAAPDSPPRELATVPRPPPSDETHFDPLVDCESDPIILGDRHYEVEADGKRYQVFYGDLHRHSNASTCMWGLEPVALDRYEFGGDVCRYDFYALTDHSNGMDPPLWWRLSKLVDLCQTPDFATLQGFEWSTKRYGHYNVVLRERNDCIVTPKNEASDPDALWARLRDGHALTIPHHSATAGKANDWSFNDPRFLRVGEIYQANLGSFEVEGGFRQTTAGSIPGHYLQDALARGLEFGLVASTDHGRGAAYAGVLAEKLDRASLFDALYARRCFAATTKGMLADFRIDRHLMGASIRCDGAPELDASVTGVRDLAQITIFRNGEVLKRVGAEIGAAGAGSQTVIHVAVRVRNQEVGWHFDLTADRGRFVNPRKDAKPTGFAPFQWQQDGERHVLWKQTEPAPQRWTEKKIPIEADDATKLVFTAVSDRHEITLGELKRRTLQGQSSNAKWVLRVLVPEERPDLTDHSLGTRAWHETFKDEHAPSGRSWYYVRAIQTDGEIVWSSPIFVTRP